MPLINEHNSHLYELYGKPNIYMTVYSIQGISALFKPTKDP